jgi:tetratricopeptide (TPR) repeat protein
MGGKDPRRWERAAAAARAALAVDDSHPDAIGLAAEALLADAVATGRNAAGKSGQAKVLLATALERGIRGPAIDRAQALARATAAAPELSAIERLRAAAPADLALKLYAGWGLGARGEHEAAIAAFSQAAQSEALKLVALSGRAHVHAQAGNLPAARADYAAILAQAKDDIAAQVGLAAALPLTQAQQRERDLLAVLERKDLAAGDPRAVALAWALSADAAAQSGRLDVARDRYRKALAIAPTDPAALAGLGEVEARDGKVDIGEEAVGRALAIAADHVGAQLVAVEIALLQKRLDEASTRLSALAARKPPLGKLERARATVLSGRLLEARGQDADAAESFVEAARLAGETDLRPALAAVTKLGQLADAADAANDATRAATLRARGDEVLAPFAASAKRDPQLALALGQAYLQSNDPAKAEAWLSEVVTARPQDADARFQLAKAQARLRRTDDAIASLKSATQLDPSRIELALELARAYEDAGRESDAAALYGAIVARADASIAARARAGRFYARRGDVAQAGVQGELIGAADPEHPAGSFLRGEAALAAGKLEDANKLFRAAVDSDRDPQYLDGQGRAAERLAIKTGDRKYIELARRAYADAVAGDATIFTAQLGLGRLYLERGEADKAIRPLLEASKLRTEDPETARLIGLSYQAIQERRVAIEWLARALKLQPLADTAWHLGQLYNEVNAPREAVTAFAAAAQLGLEEEKRTGATLPWLTEALYKLGRIHMDAGNEAAAKAAWEKYVARRPRAGVQLDEVRRELATILQR